MRNQRFPAEWTRHLTPGRLAPASGRASLLRRTRRKIDAPFLAKLNPALDRAKDMNSQGYRRTHQHLTKEEQRLRDAPIEQIQSGQSSAKQRHFTKNQATLADCYYGQSFPCMNRASLEDCPTNITMAKAKGTALPGTETDELRTPACPRSLQRRRNRPERRIAQRRRRVQDVSDTDQ